MHIWPHLRMLVCGSLASLFFLARGATADTALDVISHLNIEAGLTFVSVLVPEELATVPVNSPKRDLGTLEAAGLRVFTSGVGDTVAIMTHPTRPTGKEPVRRPLVVASYLFDSVEKGLRERQKDGLVPCSQLGQESQGLLFDLIDRAGLWQLLGLSPKREPAALDGIDLSLWGTIFVLVRDDSVRPGRVFDTFPSYFFSTPPHAFWPNKGRPLPGSMLWWLWPYTTAGWADKPVPGLESKTYSYPELVRRVSSRTEASFDIEASTEDVTARRVHVFAASPTVGSLLWAIEVTSGLQLRVTSQEPLAGILTHRRHPDAGRRPDSWVSLPGQGYLNPFRTSVGRWMSERSSVWDAGLPSNAAWRLSDLPPIYEWGLVKRALERQSVRGARKEDITIVWTRGVKMGIGRKQQAGTEFLLPVF